MTTYHAIQEGTITNKDILIYNGDAIPAYKKAPCFFHALADFMQICVVFFDGTEATVDHSEIKVA